jgi:hypothetical protein
MGVANPHRKAVWSSDGAFIELSYRRNVGQTVNSRAASNEIIFTPACGYYITIASGRYSVHYLVLAFSQT